MAQRQFRSDDTSTWAEKYGTGADGGLTVSASATDATANTTATGTGGTTALTAGSGTGFAAGNLVLIHQSQGTGAGQWELNKISSVGGGTNWTMAYSLINTYATGAQVYLLKQYSSVVVNTGVTVTSQAWTNASGKGGILAYLASSSITITGSLVASGVGFVGGQAAPNNFSGFQGESSIGPGAQGSSANGSGGGGANASNASGSGGGHGTAGANDSGGTAHGGGTVGTADLVTMVFGGGGGSGDDHSGVNSSGPGGKAGGLILLIAPNITVTGAITNIGGTGGNGANGSGGGGGGAGGAILLKGQSIALGSTLVTATGGAAGAAGSTTPGVGGVGRIHADYASSISGTTNPTIDTRLDSSLAILLKGGFVVFL